MKTGYYKDNEIRLTDGQWLMLKKRFDSELISYNSRSRTYSIEGGPCICNTVKGGCLDCPLAFNLKGINFFSPCVGPAEEIIQSYLVGFNKNSISLKATSIEEAKRKVSLMGKFLDSFATVEGEK